MKTIQTAILAIAAAVLSGCASSSDYSQLTANALKGGSPKIAPEPTGDGGECHTARVSFVRALQAASDLPVGGAAGSATKTYLGTGLIGLAISEPQRAAVKQTRLAMQAACAHLKPEDWRQYCRASATGKRGVVEDGGQRPVNVDSYGVLYDSPESAAIAAMQICISASVTNCKISNVHCENG